MTVNLTNGAAQIVMEALAQYSEQLESKEETKGLSEDFGEIITNIIRQLEQSDEVLQSFVSFTVTGATSLTPERIMTSFNNLSITTSEFGLVNDFGNFASVQDCEFRLNDVEWIDKEKAVL
jgi:hypothetical protein